MMDFFPRMAPWALITYNMTAELPSGTFYLFSDVRVARTSKPTEFELSTDSNTPVNITINDQFIGTIIPKTTVQPVYINLFEPPAINYLTADNGVDEPVHIAIAATYEYVDGVWCQGDLLIRRKNIRKILQPSYVEVVVFYCRIPATVAAEPSRCALHAYHGYQVYGVKFVCRRRYRGWGN